MTRREEGTVGMVDRDAEAVAAVRRLIRRWERAEELIEACVTVNEAPSVPIATPEGQTGAWCGIPVAALKRLDRALTGVERERGEPS